MADNCFIGVGVSSGVFITLLIIVLINYFNPFITNQGIVITLYILIACSLVFGGVWGVSACQNQSNNKPPSSPPPIATSLPPSSTSPPLPPVPPPTFAPVQPSSDILYAIFDTEYDLDQAKRLLCQATNGKCTTPESLEVFSFRSLDRETRISFRDKDGFLRQEDIRLDGAVGYVYTEPETSPSVSLSVIPFSSYKNEIIPPQIQIPGTQTTLPPTFPPGTNATEKPDPQLSCVDYADWVDAKGNACSAYTDQKICFVEGTNPSNGGAISSCDSISSETQCTSQVSRRGVALCQWNTTNGTCTSRSVYGIDACCRCGGGRLVDLSHTSPPPITYPPFESSQPPSSTSPPTTSPPSPGPIGDVLSIEGLSEFDTSGFKMWNVPLYVYNLTHYNPGPSAEFSLEQLFMGPLPAPLGTYPKLNTETGKFDNMPNVIVPLQANQIQAPAGIELGTEPVGGGVEGYYLFIKIPVCGDRFFPLYGNPTIQYEESAKSSMNYFTLLNANGRPLNLSNLMVCRSIDFDTCMCNPSLNQHWISSNEKRVIYPDVPEVLYESCPTNPPIDSQNSVEQEYNSTRHPYENTRRTVNCQVSADVDIIWLDQIRTDGIVDVGKPETLEDTPGIVSDNYILYGYTASELQQLCPGEWSACQGDAQCAQDVARILDEWQSIKDQTLTNDQIFQIMSGETLNITNSQLLYNLKYCVYLKNKSNYENGAITCDNLKNYYKTCKFNNDILTIPRDTTDLTDSQAVEYISFLIIEPQCMFYMAQPNTKSFWEQVYRMARQITYARVMGIQDYNPDDYPQSAGQYAFQGFQPWNAIQNDCCSGNASTEPAITYTPRDPSIPIRCDDTISQCAIL